MNQKMQENPDQWLTSGTHLIQKNTNQLLDLTNQILELQKLETQDYKLELYQDDIIPYIRYIVDMFKSYAAEKNIDLSLQTSGDSVVMDYDQKKMQWVISNLISNAIKFTPENGKINVLTSKQGSTFMMEVSDTGIGISEEDQKKIFDRFYQVQHPSHPNGSGIGLALVKEIVRQLKGDIHVQSEEGRGSTFTISLPITVNAPQKTAENYIAKLENVIQIEESESSDGLPILLMIEDNEDMTHYLSAALGEDYQLIIAKNGKEGLVKAYQTIPDIVVSDVMMPEMNGYDLCYNLKTDERTNHIPVILLTAKASDQSRLTGIEKGADAYLTKPFNETELKLRIRKLLETRSILQSKYEMLSQIDATETSPEVTVDPFIQKIIDFVEEEKRLLPFELEELCNHLHMSRSQVFRKLKALTDKSPSRLIRSIRLKNAKSLLKTSDLNIAEVAYEVGFSSTSYFSKCYFEEYGERPSSAKS